MKEGQGGEESCQEVLRVGVDDDQMPCRGIIRDLKTASLVGPSLYRAAMAGQDNAIMFRKQETFSAPEAPRVS